jgi:hypothetical protein
LKILIDQNVSARLARLLPGHDVGVTRRCASTRTTQLYDRRREEMSLDEVERIKV